MTNRATLIVLRGLLAVALAPGMAAAAAQGPDLTAMLASNAAAQATAVSGPIIVVTPLALDFGIVDNNTSGSITLNIACIGDQTLHISSMGYSDPAYSSPSVTTLAGGTNQNILVTFSPFDGLSHPATLTIQSDALNGTQIVPLMGQGNAPPTLNAIGDKTVSACGSLFFTVTATDVDDTVDDQLTFSMGSGLPPGANFNTHTGEFSWAPSVADVGSYSVTFGVSDGRLSDSETIHITVPATSSPQIVGSDEVCAASVGNGYSVSNVPVDATSLAWSITGNGTIVGPADGTSVTINAGSAGSFTLTVTVDGCIGNSGQKVVVVKQCVGNCPRTAGFWTQQVAQKGNGSTKFTVTQVSQIAECVDDHSALFSWPSGTDFSSFGATVNPPSPMNQRKQAKRQFATILANVCTGQLGLIANNGDKIFLGLDTPINCAGLTSGTIGGVIGEVDGRLVSLEGQPLSDPLVKDEYSNLIACLDAINNGIGIGTVCPEAAPVPGGGIGLARGVVGRVFAALPAPNPFSQSTYFVLAVTGAESKPVDVRVFDVSGKLVRILATGSLPPGRHEMVWDGYSEQARRMPTGVYFLQSAVGGDKAVIRLLYLR